MNSARLTGIIRDIPDSCWTPCADKDEGEVAEFGYRIRDDRVFRRYVVKRIRANVGEQMEIETAGYHHCWSELLGCLDEDGHARQEAPLSLLQYPGPAHSLRRRLVLKLQRDYPLLDRFVGALARLNSKSSLRANLDVLLDLPMDLGSKSPASG